jgi:hypothetical protein
MLTEMVNTFLPDIHNLSSSEYYSSIFTFHHEADGRRETIRCQKKEQKEKRREIVK